MTEILVNPGRLTLKRPGPFRECASQMHLRKLDYVWCAHLFAKIGLMFFLGGAANAQSINVTNTPLINEQNGGLAHNPVSDEFLIVWADAAGNIQGQLRMADGSPAGNFTIFEAQPDRRIRYEEPAAVFKEMGDIQDIFFVIAKRIEAESSVNVVGRRIEVDGDSRDPVPIEVSGTELIRTSELKGRPAIASSTNAGSCCILIVWRQGNAIRGAHWPGTLPTPADPPKAPPSAIPFDIAEFTGTAAPSPSVAYQQSPGEEEGRERDHFLVAYGARRTTGEPFVEVSRIRPGSRIPVSRQQIATTQTPENPDVSYNNLSQTFMVVWRNRAQAFGWRLDNAGVPIGDGFTITPLASMAVIDSPIVHSATDTEEFVAVYQWTAFASFSLGGARFNSSTGERLENIGIEGGGFSPQLDSDLAYSANRGAFATSWAHEPVRESGLHEIFLSFIE